MIDKERYDALMGVAIDPSLFHCEEAEFLSRDLALNPHQYFDQLRNDYGDVIEVKDNCIADVSIPTLIRMDPEKPGAFITGYETVRSVVTNQQDFYQNYTHTMDILMGEGQIAGSNPPHHKPLRALIRSAFDKGSVDLLQEEYILPLIQGLISRIAEKEDADLVEDFTCRLPTLLIGEIFQLPVDDYPKFARLVSELMSATSGWEIAFSASQSLGELFYELIEQRKSTPGSDLISRMLEAEIDGEKLSDVEMMSFCRALVPAGIDTTTRSLSSMFSLILSKPDCWQSLVNNPDAIPPAIEEVIRHSGPVMMIPKRTTRELELAGVKLAKDTNVYVCIGHANRDPSIWDNPHAFDIERERKPSLGFSLGAHMCIGNQLARREMQDALRSMIDKLPGLQLNPRCPEPEILGVQSRCANRIDVVTGVH